MEITCQSCSAKLSIPDDKLPKNVPVVMGKCPQCQKPIEIRLQKDGAQQTTSTAAAPPHAPSAAAPPAAGELLAGHKLAMACFDDPQKAAPVKAALESLGYTAAAPAKVEEALASFRRSKFDVLVLHEEFGGAAMLKALQPLAMNQRRHCCVLLVGKAFKTHDNMTAFAKSVNFVVAEADLDKIKTIAGQAVMDNDQFYRIFRESLHDAGRA